MSDTPAPVAFTHAGHTARIKWHRARRRAADTPFTRERIVEGMQVGASIEIDLVIHAERGFAVLHDRHVDDATTGTGRVENLSARYLRGLFLRTAGGEPDPSPVLLLDDLTGILGESSIHPDALLQLDFKENAAALDDAAIGAFAEAVGDIREHTILSCGDAEAVAILTGAVPGIRIGYDPCHHGAADVVLRSGDYASFVDAAVRASPDAETVYLERRLILDAGRRDVDLIGAFHRRERTVDAYTFPGAFPADSDDPVVHELHALAGLLVDQITADDPEGIAAHFA